MVDTSQPVEVKPQHIATSCPPEPLIYLYILVVNSNNVYVTLFVPSNISKSKKSLYNCLVFSRS